jgi:hypothetical protein
MAARLEKLYGTSFAVSHRGFNFQSSSIKFLREQMVIKKVEIRGIGDNELIAILHDEFSSLSAEDCSMFRNP